MKIIKIVIKFCIRSEGEEERGVGGFCEYSATQVRCTWNGRKTVVVT